MLSFSFRANYPTLSNIKMSYRIDYEIESHHAILIEPTNQCEISYDGFGEEVAKPDYIEIVEPQNKCEIKPDVEFNRKMEVISNMIISGLVLPSMQTFLSFGVIAVFL